MILRRLDSDVRRVQGAALLLVLALPWLHNDGALLALIGAFGVIRTGPKSTGAHRVLLGSAAALALGIVCAVSLYRGSSPPSSADGPEERIWKMAQAAQDGDADAYLASFTGPLYDRLLAQSRQQPEQFATQIQASVADLTGLSVLERNFPEPNRAELLVERVFARYNERQLIGLRRAGAVWKIDQLGMVQRRVPEIAYGSPVLPGVSSDAAKPPGDSAGPREP